MILGLPNVGLALYLFASACREIARGDGTGEAMLAGIVLLVSLGLVLFAVPALFWGFTCARRARRANRVRLAVAAVLSLGSFIPVLLMLLSFVR